MATENILMKSVKKGGNRQELHEKLRTHSHAAARKVKMEGGSCDLIDRIAQDHDFPLTAEEIHAELDPALYTGRSASQTVRFAKEIAQPVIDKFYKGDVSTELKV